MARLIAETRVPPYRDGAWFVGFADITDLQLIAPAICQALGLAEQPELSPAQCLKQWLSDRELLLLLEISSSSRPARRSWRSCSPVVLAGCCW